MAARLESLQVSFQNAVSAGADAATASMKKLGEAVTQTDERVTKAEKSVGELQRQYDPLVRTTSALEAAERRRTRAISDMEAAVRREGATEQDQARLLNGIIARHEADVARITKAQRAQAASSREAGAASGLQAYQVQNLVAQFQDLAVQIGSGQGLFRPLLQQGPQITSVFGGTRQTLAAASSAIRAIGPATIVGTAGMVALAGGFLLALNRAEEAQSRQRLLSVTIAAVGKSGDTSAGQLSGYAKALQLTGTNADDANQIVSRLARLPALTGSAIGEVTKRVGDLAVAMGTDAPEAAATLGAAFSGNFQAITKLDDALNFLSADQLKAVRTALDHGNRTSALTVTIGALDSRIKGLRDNSLTPMDKAFEDLSKSWKTFSDGITNSSAVITALKALSGGISIVAAAGRGLASAGDLITGAADQRTPSDRVNDELEQAQQRLETLRSQTARYQDRNQETSIPGFGFGSPAAIEAQIQAQIKDLQGARARMPATTGATSTIGATAATVAGADGLTDAERQRQQKGLDDANRSLDEQQRIMAASLPNRARVRAEIQAEAEAREKGLTGSAREELIRSRVAEAMLSEGDAARQEMVSINMATRAALASANAADQGRAAYLRSQAAMEAHSQAATRAGVSESSLTRAILARNAAQELAKAKEQALGLGDQIAAAQRLGGAAAQGFGALHLAELNEQAQALTANLVAAAQATGDPAQIERANLVRDAIRGQVLELDNVNQKLDEQRALLSSSQAIEYAQKERDLAWSSAEARDAELAALRERQTIQARGGDVNSVGSLERINAARTVSGLQSETQRLSGYADDTKQAFSSAFSSAMDGGTKLSSVLKQIDKDLAQIVLRATLLDPLSKSIGGLVGSGLGSLFGGGSSAGTGGSSLITSDVGGLTAIGALPFAKGGIMTSGGSLPLNRYANGGVANTPQLAMFGEGRTPEAYVPLADGRSIPVSMRGGGMDGGSISISQSYTIDARNADPGAAVRLVAAMEATKKATKAELLADINRGGSTAKTVGRRSR